MYNKVHTHEYLSDNFPNKNGLNQSDVLLPLLFNFALEHSIRKVQENQVWLKLSRTYLLPAYAHDVTLMKDNIDTIKKTTETAFMLVKRLI
jgi:hypothetical protein